MHLCVIKEPDLYALYDFRAMFFCFSVLNLETKDKSSGNLYRKGTERAQNNL